MKLPPELRLNVYRHLFTDMTINRQRKVEDLTIFHPWQDWPDNDFTAYLNLLLTCKTVCDEAKGLWEKEYAHHCCFYFWRVHELYRAAMSLVALGEPYQHMSYALRSTSDIELRGRESDELLDHQADEFRKTRPGFPLEEYARFHFTWPYIDGEQVMQTSPEIPHMPCVYYETDVTEDEIQDAGRADLLGPEGCSITLHERGNHDARYLLMSGKVEDIIWKDYDAMIGHVHLEIAKICDRRGWPSTCIGMSVRALEWRAKALSGKDRAWLALGGKRGDLKDVDEMEENYNLSGWLKLMLE